MIKGGKRMKNYAVIIPAYRPKEKLLQYVEALLQHNVAQIIVVSDGNNERYRELFHQLSSIEFCTVLYHKFNHGKGRSLKTAFKYFLKHYSALSGVVTADADGQHLVEDVLKVGEHLERNKEGFVLGIRDFERRNIPLRSLIGNVITSRVFQGLSGTYIKDTQTGLRGIATSELKWVMQLKGNHFDYEMNMLINMIKKKKRIVHVDIAAVYEEKHISYFNTYKDSVRIVEQIIREYFSKII